MRTCCLCNHKIWKFLKRCPLQTLLKQLGTHAHHSPQLPGGTALRFSCRYWPSSAHRSGRGEASLPRCVLHAQSQSPRLASCQRALSLFFLARSHHLHGVCFPHRYIDILKSFVSCLHTHPVNEFSE